MTGAATAEFLVAIELAAPVDVDADKLDRLREAEARRAAELASNGSLLRLWRPPGSGWRNIGLWCAVDEADLREILATLPLWPWMTVEVTALGRHPNDPRPAGAPAAWD
ncbi:muconolactone Delta-isomerase family protein [Aeromicrobium sp. CF4.19]|uniref:muconolactone Delta-isomerase family protein n=1 Tax=Aeromicrobium sp. CF4.19 TaxID=3373082 RepID=UPI003EE7E22A